MSPGAMLEFEIFISQATTSMCYRSGELCIIKLYQSYPCCCLNRLSSWMVWLWYLVAISSRSSSKTARDDEGSDKNSDESENGWEGGEGGYSDLVDWRVGGISSSLTARLPFVLKPERRVNNSQIIQTKVSANQICTLRADMSRFLASCWRSSVDGNGVRAYIPLSASN